VAAPSTAVEMLRKAKRTGIGSRGRLSDRQWHARNEKRGESGGWCRSYRRETPTAQPRSRVPGSRKLMQPAHLRPNAPSQGKCAGHVTAIRRTGTRTASRTAVRTLTRMGLARAAAPSTSGPPGFFPEAARPLKRTRSRRKEPPTRTLPSRTTKGSRPTAHGDLEKDS
jgi:hypothetical protein